jgi:hypothetical protein
MHLQNFAKAGILFAVYFPGTHFHVYPKTPGRAGKPQPNGSGPMTGWGLHIFRLCGRWASWSAVIQIVGPYALINTSIFFKSSQY